MINGGLCPARVLTQFNLSLFLLVYLHMKAHPLTPSPPLPLSPSSPSAPLPLSLSPPLPPPLHRVGFAAVMKISGERSKTVRIIGILDEYSDKSVIFWLF